MNKNPPEAANVGFFQKSQCENPTPVFLWVDTDGEAFLFLTVWFVAGKALKCGKGTAIRELLSVPLAMMSARASTLTFLNSWRRCALAVPGRNQPLGNLGKTLAESAIERGSCAAQ